MSIAVVHLVWAPLGVAPLRDFLASYNAHPAGSDHELVVALNGMQAPGGGGEEFRSSVQDELARTPHRPIVLERPVLDLAAYGLLARQLEHPRICFLNSYSVILADGWLAILADALAVAGVGLAGASGSWESQSEWRRGRFRYWPYQTLRLPVDRNRYPRFPNPHMRTTGFMIERAAIAGLGLQDVGDKRDAYLLESGTGGIASRIAAEGESMVVAGRDGRVYGQQEWPESCTYRSGEQRNLLISDNRTREWEASPSRLKRRLARDAWGSRAII
jgi:hypothetical protein